MFQIECNKNTIFNQSWHFLPISHSVAMSSITQLNAFGEANKAFQGFWNNFAAVGGGRWFDELDAKKTTSSTAGKRK